MRVLALTLTTLSLVTVGTMAPLHAQRRSNTISLEEIEKSGTGAHNAYEVVQTLRPRWLQVHELSHPPSNDEVPQSTPLYVYVDDVRMGPVDYLKTIPVDRVLAMSWLGQNEAASRYGPGDGQVIVVFLKH